MEFFKKLFKKPDILKSEDIEETNQCYEPKEYNNESQLKIRGLTEIGYKDKCPYCLKILEKIPGRKKKCEFCGEYIYVRTRPLDRKKILVTEKQLDDVENQWQIYHLVKPLMNDPNYNKVKNELTKKFGKEPYENEVLRELYNHQIREYASKNQWGDYFITKQNMALLLKSEGNIREALHAFFEVCYLQLNEIYTFGTLALDNVFELIIRLGISLEEAGEIFCEINEKLKGVAKIDLSPEDAWKKLYKEIKPIKRIVALDVDDLDSITDEIDSFINKKEYKNAANIIEKIRSDYYPKKRRIENLDKLKFLLKKILAVDQESILDAAESLLILLAKKDNQFFEELVLNHVNFIKNNLERYLENHTIGQLGEINPLWVKSLIPDLIIVIKTNPEWNHRRFAAFHIGSIGSKNPNFVKDSIPIMIEYIKNPVKITPDKGIIFERNGISVSIGISSNIDQTQWLKDAYIDTLGMIAEGDPSLIDSAIPILRKIEKKDKSEYSRKKAQNTLDIYERKTKQ